MNASWRGIHLPPEYRMKSIQWCFGNHSSYPGNFKENDANRNYISELQLHWYALTGQTTNKTWHVTTITATTVSAQLSLLKSLYPSIVNCARAWTVRCVSRTTSINNMRPTLTINTYKPNTKTCNICPLLYTKPQAGRTLSICTTSSQ